MDAMVEAGMTPMQAVVAATMGAAELLGLSDRIGSVAPGKLADLIVVEANPLGDISLLQDGGNILAVFQSGNLVMDRGIKLKK